MICHQSPLNHYFHRVSACAFVSSKLRCPQIRQLHHTALHYCRRRVRSTEELPQNASEQFQHRLEFAESPAELTSSVTAIKNLMSFPIFRCKTAHSDPGVIRNSWFAPYSLKPSSNSEKIQLWRMVRSLVMATRVVDQELRTWRRDEECQREVSRNIDSIDGFVAENLYREKERSLAIFIVPNIFQRRNLDRQVSLDGVPRSFALVETTRSLNRSN